jgi:putative membrane protein
MIRLTRPAVAGAALAVAVLACQGKKEEYSSGALDTTRGATAAARDTAMSTPAPATSKWTSPNIIGYVETANSGEIALGKLGRTKARNPDVRKYAVMIVTDHTSMLADAKKLATKLSVTADTTADDVSDAAKDGHDALKDLNEKAAGADWDKDFIDKMVDGHQKVLDKLQDAAKNTNDTELRAALETAVGKVQTHLTKAQDLKERLNK